MVDSMVAFERLFQVIELALDLYNLLGRDDLGGGESFSKGLCSEKFRNRWLLDSYFDLYF